MAIQKSMPRPPADKAHTKRRRRRIVLAALVGVPLLVLAGVTAYYYSAFAKVVDDRLQGERLKALSRVYARPLEFRRGQWISMQQFAERLNVLGYAERPSPSQPGEFSRGEGVLTIVSRGGDLAGQTVRLRLEPVTRGAGLPVGSDGRPVSTSAIARIEVQGGEAIDLLRLDAPLLTTLITTSRQKRRRVSLSLIPPHVVQAVLAIEDHRFYGHPGIDPIRIVGAIRTNLEGKRPYLEGASTITQQLVKNFFLTPEKSYRRKIQEQLLAIVLETRATKDEILEIYLNDVYLGQRGSYAVHGVAQAARMFFGKDVTNLSLAEAATIAGVIQTPYRHSPFTSQPQSRERRNVVLQAMADRRFVSREAAARASEEPIQTVARALDTEAPYFVDLIGQVMADEHPGVLEGAQGVDIYTTLDVNLQRTAQEAVQAGLVQIDALLAKRGVKGRAQVALIAVEPATGDILAYVGGRSYSQSQFNRAVNARRQPGSVFKPFVYLAAFETAAAEGRTDITPATLVADEQTTFTYGDEAWTPRNYEDEYDGPITLRRALANSRNVATVRVAEMVGFDRVAALWRRVGTSMAPRAFPSIALGVFEATPLEVVKAYTVFPNLGETRPPTAIARLERGSETLALVRPERVRVARADTAFLVTSLMRSVINEGTGAGARGMGFVHDAAGKTGTTNDLRDAWFVGFTPELLTAVWVGFDDNQPLGMSGSAAALPIWTRFMMAALAGRPNVSFPTPAGVTFADIDRDTGALAQPACPRVTREVFLVGTEPASPCELHRF